MWALEPNEYLYIVSMKTHLLRCPLCFHWTITNEWRCGMLKAVYTLLLSLHPHPFIMCPHLYACSKPVPLPEFSCTRYAVNTIAVSKWAYMLTHPIWQMSSVCSLSVLPLLLPNNHCFFNHAVSCNIYGHKMAQKVKLNAVFLASGNRKQLSQTAEEKKENWPWSFKVLSLASGNLWAKLAEFACHSHKTNVNEDCTNRVYVGPQNCPRILLWASLNSSVSASTDPVQWYENLITYVRIFWKIFVDSTNLLKKYLYAK